MHHLLDTHTIIWFINGDPELSEKARNLIEKDSTANFVSVASLWEIAIKVSLEKLELRGPFSEIKSQLDQNGFQLLPINWEDTLLIASLPFHHRHPFDRILIAQSINNRLSIITKDDQFKKYPVSLIW
jgi:PIN domain nuclease of toxin-antitoxin system